MRRAQHQMIPGIPALHQGGSVIHQLTGHTQSFQDLIALPGQIAQSGIFDQGQAGTTTQNLGNGLIGVFVNGELIDIRSAPSGGGGGGGAAAPQFRPGEFQLMQEQFAFEQEAFQLDLELRRLQEQHSNAIARGQLALARRTEARIDRIQTRQNQLEQQRIRLDRQRLGVEASLGRAQGISGLASSRGQIEAQRASELSRLAANPRDFAQLNIGLGGGQGFIGQLLNQQGVGGQSTSLIGGTPTLGADFQRLLQSITARPDVPLFEEAADLFRNVPQFRKGGTHMVTDEPVVGIGMITGQPKFTLGEPAPGFPQGKPEKLEVTPLAHGGTVKAGSNAANPFSPGTTAEDIISGATGGAAKPTTPAQSQFTFPDFPGIGQLVEFLFEGSGLKQAQQNFGTGGVNAITLGQEVQNFQQSIPRTPGEAIRSLMSGLGPQQFNSLLPSQLGLLESVVSALGVPPQDFITSLLRNFPTGPDPSSISFGNF